MPGGGRPLRRHAGRRAAARRPAAARPGRGREPRPSGAVGRGRSPAPTASRLGALPPRARRCSTRSPAGGPRTPSGRRCRGRTGRSGSPRPPRRPSRPGGARCSWCPTSVTSTRCTPPARRWLGADARGRAHRRARARPSATGGGSRCAAGACGSWSAPGRPRSRRCAELGLLAVWDDGDDLHAEPRAPYPHVRDVLVLRAHARRGGAAGRRVRAHRRGAAARRVRLGARDRRRPRRRCAPRRRGSPRSGRPTASSPATPTRAPPGCPHVAFEAARAALAAGRPVLVQVPRSGYVPWLACGACRETARCRHCAGPLGLHRRSRPADAGAAALPHCRWCGRRRDGVPLPGLRRRAGCAPAWSGAGRTAEELGRAFPGHRGPRAPGGGAPVLATVPRPARAGGRHARRRAARRRRVRRGPAAGRLGAAVAPRPARRRGDAAALAGRGRAGACRTATAAGWSWSPTPTLPPVQALVRWDPAGHAAAELAGARRGRVPARGADGGGRGRARRPSPRWSTGCSPTCPRSRCSGPSSSTRRRARTTGRPTVARARAGAGAAGRGQGARRRLARRAGRPQGAQGGRPGPGAARPGRDRLSLDARCPAARGLGAARSSVSRSYRGVPQNRRPLAGVRGIAVAAAHPARRPPSSP